MSPRASSSASATTTRLGISSHVVIVVLAVVTLLIGGPCPCWAQSGPTTTLKLGASVYGLMQASNYLSAIQSCEQTPPPANSDLKDVVGIMVDYTASARNADALNQLCASQSSCWTYSNTSVVESNSEDCPYMLKSVITVSGGSNANFNLNYRSCSTDVAFLCQWSPPDNTDSSSGGGSGGFQSSVVVGNKLLTLQPAADYATALEACSSLPGNGGLVNYDSPIDPAVPSAMELLCQQVPQGICWVTVDAKEEDKCPYIEVTSSSTATGEADCQEGLFFVCEQDQVVNEVIYDPPPPSSKQEDEPRDVADLGIDQFSSRAPGNDSSGSDVDATAIIVATIVPVVCVALLSVGIFFYLRHKRLERAVDDMMNIPLQDP